MDGRGRALDNIFIERLWRSPKNAYGAASNMRTSILSLFVPPYFRYLFGVDNRANHTILF
jgi:hypothetical protein